MVKVKIDMTGWKMWEHGFPKSRLTVIEQTEDYIYPNGTKDAQWLCECSCPEHNKIKVCGRDIKKGDVLSCGCLKKETISKINKKYNKYDLSGEYGIGWTFNTNREFYFDIEDYDKIKDYCWSEQIKNNTNYSRLVARDKDKKQNIAMHYLIKGKYCDHIDRNPLNNRRCNLRIATPLQNSRNRGVYKNNQSGITGVNWDKKNCKWRAYIRANKRFIWLGYFVDKNSAIRARLNAEAKYYGKFAPQQHLYEQYGIKTLQNDCENQSNTYE